jgi:glycosyltransferase involved in cell wall biosynthesis
VAALPLNSGNPATLARLAVALRRVVREFRPDAVNCHRGESFWLWGAMRAAGAPFRLVRTRGDQRLPRNNAPNRWLHNRCADAVVATNSVMHAHFRDAFGIGPDRLHLILGGVDRERFAFDPEGRARVRAEFGYGPQDFVVGLLGRFDEVKGQRELIRAVAQARLAPGGQRLRLMLAGFETATTLAEVRGWIDAAGLGEATTITGQRPDVAAVISAMDLGVVASKWSETIARAALEIMSCGRPLVGTSVGVMPDLLGPEALLPPADVPALARAVARAATDPGHLRALAAAQARTIATLSGRDFLERTLAVYAGGRP